MMQIISVFRTIKDLGRMIYFIILLFSAVTIKDIIKVKSYCRIYSKTYYRKQYMVGYIYSLYLSLFYIDFELITYIY